VSGAGRSGEADRVKRLLLLGAAVALLGAAPAAASPAVRLSIVHYVRGCHVWKGMQDLGPAATLKVARGTKVTIRIDCPMAFDFAQTAGPRLDLGNPRTFAGTTRTIVFRKAGLYRLVGTNVQSSAEQGLQTLGDDNTLSLTVRVK
jgi:hypothetical protein